MHIFLVLLIINGSLSRDIKSTLKIIFRTPSIIPSIFPNTPIPKLVSLNLNDDKKTEKPEQQGIIESHILNGMRNDIQNDMKNHAQNDIKRIHKKPSINTLVDHAEFALNSYLPSNEILKTLRRSKSNVKIIQRTLDQVSTIHEKYMKNTP